MDCRSFVDRFIKDYKRERKEWLCDWHLSINKIYMLTYVVAIAKLCGKSEQIKESVVLPVSKSIPEHE
jgi:hypothetical protein